MKRSLLSLGLFALLFLMLSHPALCFSGAKSGLVLWLYTIVPTLLPFIILSNYFIHSNIVTHIGPIPYCFLFGFLCGFPLGAKSASDLYQNRIISIPIAQFLLGCCNHISPNFIITYVVLQSLDAPDLLFPFLLAFYGGAILQSICLAFIYRKHFHRFKKEHTDNFLPIDDCIVSGFLTLFQLGGYILLFSILCKIAMHYAHTDFSVILLSMLEITNGVNLLTSYFCVSLILEILLLALIIFGGVCTLFQTIGIVKQTPLSISTYLLHKCLHFVISLPLFLFLVA